MGSDKVSISEWIANAIADTGCTVVYGGHGGALVPLVNAVCDHPQLTWVYGRNEHNAATMAAAHAKMTGGLGVVIATSGPGATSLTTGLLEATMDRVPLLAITGMKPTAQLGYAEFQDVNQSRLFAGGGVEWSKDVSSAHAALPLLRDAVATALTQRTCVHLAIPVDIQAAPSPLPLKHFCASHADLRIQSPVVDLSMVEDTAKTLVGMTEDGFPRSIIAVGQRAIPRSNSDINMSKILLELAESLNAPVLTRLHAKGVVDERHPLAFGVIGVHGKPGLKNAASLISSSDIVISIGVADETLLACNMAGIQIRRIVEIEPDAMCVNTRFNAEHTLIGNIVEVCQALTNRIKELTSSETISRRHRRLSSAAGQFRQHFTDEQMYSLWDYMAHSGPEMSVSDGEVAPLTQLRRVSTSEVHQDLLEDTDTLWKKVHSDKWKDILKAKIKENFHTPRYVLQEGENKDHPYYCHPASVLRALSLARFDEAVDTIARDAVIAVDVGDVTLWASLCLSLQGGSRTLYSERLGTMGYALCAGIAGILAKPEPAAAVVLAGDGGFQMSLQELSTFQQMKRPGDKLICIILDNQVLGRVAFGFDNAGGCELHGPDYVKLAEAYGGKGIRLDKSDDADRVIREALGMEGLVVIHVLVDGAVKADMATFRDTSLDVMNSG